MEIKIQQCNSCGSRDLRNILVRDESQKVFVQCRSCGKLVARYVLAHGGYHHAGKDFESFLRSIERDGGIESARDLPSAFENAKQQLHEEYEALKPRLLERYGDNLP